jgi:uncharacterized protein (TIGR01319 family)
MSQDLCWLFDIGSTFTKAAAVAPDGSVATASAPTTLHDLGKGLRAAAAATGLDPGRARLRAACSSAAGGLAMVVSGFVPRLSLEAAQRAALGAGAKLVGSWGFDLTARHVAAIDAVGPNVILLTGGTDGGDRRVLVGNARALASLKSRPAVVVAGNRDVADESADLLRDAGFEARTVPNILPTIDRIEAGPARAAIRDLFLERIATGPGLAEIGSTMDIEVVPTPKAVLDAVELIGQARGVPLLAVEVGGATTNVHSFASVPTPDPRVVRRGLPPDILTRTVEGDLGVRHNARIVAELASAEWFEKWAPDLGDNIGPYVAKVAGTSHIATNDKERLVDRALALFCLRRGTERHVGHREVRWTHDGDVFVEYGKDLRGVNIVIATGGSIIHTVSVPDIERVLSDLGPDLLAPSLPRVVIDRGYILYGVGLLAHCDPDLACEIADRSLFNQYQAATL